MHVHILVTLVAPCIEAWDESTRVCCAKINSRLGMTRRTRIINGCAYAFHDLRLIACMACSMTPQKNFFSLTKKAPKRLCASATAKNCADRPWCYGSSPRNLRSSSIEIDSTSPTGGSPGRPSAAAPPPPPPPPASHAASPELPSTHKSRTTDATSAPRPPGTRTRNRPAAAAAAASPPPPPPPPPPAPALPIGVHAAPTSSSPAVGDTAEAAEVAAAAAADSWQSRVQPAAAGVCPTLRMFGPSRCRRRRPPAAAAASLPPPPPSHVRTPAAQNLPKQKHAATGVGGGMHAAAAAAAAAAVWPGPRCSNVQPAAKHTRRQTLLAGGGGGGGGGGGRGAFSCARTRS